MTVSQLGGENKPTPKVYEADGAVIRKLPVQTEVEGGVQISIGFPVCTLTEWCDDQGEAVAEIMNRGELYASSQEEIARLSAIEAELWRLSLVIESAIRNADWPNYAEVLALIKLVRRPAPAKATGAS